jgi:hypothetical protein
LSSPDADLLELDPFFAPTDAGADARWLATKDGDLRFRDEPTFVIAVAALDSVIEGESSIDDSDRCLRFLVTEWEGELSRASSAPFES